MRYLTGFFLLAALVSTAILTGGCSDRVETPSYAADSTLVYPGKEPADVAVTITFASRSKTSKRTGRRLGVSDTFETGEGSKVHAFVDITNRFARDTDLLDFHLVWIKPDDKTAFKKRIEYIPTDSDTTLTSALSIPPGRRKPGRYKLRVYLFRELIAEKSFLLIGEGEEAEKEEAGALM
jgi:hypothetical protein